MFKEVPDEIGDDDDPVSLTLAEMDRFGVERGLVTVEGDDGQRALKEHPHRFIPSVGVDPNQGMDAHGCEPWADLAVKLMLKWPNLYYSTSAFAT